MKTALALRQIPIGIEEKTIARLIRKSELYFSDACIEDIEYRADGKLYKAQIQSAFNYVQKNHNLIILSTSGAGKSYMSCAFGIAVCRNPYTVKYIRLPDLLNKFAVARGEGIL